MILESRLKTSLAKLLELLNEEKIASLDDIRSRIGGRFQVSDSLSDYVSFEERPSNFGTTAYVVAYTIPGVGIPVEARVNPRLFYSKVILKFNGLLYGYKPFRSDDRGNIIQDKRLDTINWDDVKAELERLTC